ncbi:GCN5 family N-acetyltransferase [Pseudolysinimonas kribbensis]|uniref:GCN5 family N-acetyltransferase n=1 Tax=Pseudolysinimonas kribbensis TaxID=433641 RepID=A0ABQ6KCK2_9MICO|nr:GNAT family N-acetyltransferase [Pseudolysinimonas kribbensis]GMA96490.1 GCN5 family N-acetyltransferase [Pseudolysinimonas kribbensis]
MFRAYGAFYETAFDDAQLDHVGELLLDSASGIDVIVAEDDAGRVVGFAHFRSHPDTFSAGHDWFLDDLFVEPDTRGGGIGSALVEAVAQRARATGPAGTLRWITAQSNERAQRVYDRVARRTTWVTYEKDL